jgi:hypothetical protein
MVTDAWYIDLSQRLSCDPKPPEGKQGHAYLAATSGKQPLDRPEFVAIGEPERGFPLNSVMTVKSAFTPPEGATKAFRFEG